MLFYLQFTSRIIIALSSRNIIFMHLTKALPFDVVRLIVSKWLLQFSLPFIKFCFIMEQLIYDLVYILTPRYMLPT